MEPRIEGIDFEVSEYRVIMDRDERESCKRGLSIRNSCDES
jgi:hypothetical protein